MIEFALGNRPIGHDVALVKGSAAVIDSPTRIALWNHSGDEHADYRGDAKALSAVLADFAKLEAKDKRIVLHNGIGESLPLNFTNDPAKRADAAMDWTFTVWDARVWPHALSFARRLPGQTPDSNCPPPQIDVYTGGNVNWSDVIVPQGIEVVDERLEAHGFTLADGIVLEGKVTDLVTHQPLAARIRVEREERGPKGPTGITVVGEATADAQGHWVLKNASATWDYIVVEADGYVPRHVGAHRRLDQPGWHSYDCGLCRPASVSGRVTDAAGSPLADVEVNLDSFVVGSEGYYDWGHHSAKTDADGRFDFDQVPVGTTLIWLNKSGYSMSDKTARRITTPVKDLAVMMMVKAAQLHVTVDFTGVVRPKEYSVEIEAEGGANVGTWGGSGNIDANKEISFHDVPPGKYVLKGHPNPYNPSQMSKPLTIDVKGGETAEITLSAK
jgi:hypothetical protein